ncbi:MAG: carbon starvation protein A [Bacteroidetes bacterium HGW-Bacteroidetes-6]|jgi:carbon starvation protein CstA|nr:MAG: carbon starvation protein A [Bacteroidetes bacterium HGW-Bacteroidetes-6]
MLSFSLAVLALIAGYLIYGRLMEKIFGVEDNRKTPAFTHSDGVDFVPLPWYKVFLIQFLNIAGLGPIFGAIAGAMWGPSAFLWIVFGSVFGGAVHDYLSGMMSIRHNGASLPELTGKYLGKLIMQFMRVFTIGLMILVGAVFIVGPAEIIASITPFSIYIAGWIFETNLTFWAIIIFIYYLLATLLPIDKLIGRLYPIFGFALIFMAFSIITALLSQGYQIPELIGNISNQHYKGDAMPIFPMMFISIACGAISGFHATQSPLMARCIKSEKYGRRVFYGAMISEGIIALIWAAAAMTFFGGVDGLNGIIGVQGKSAAYVVNEISNSLLGKFGVILAILGVVAAPITSGDTAFRSARLIVADFLHYKQTKLSSRIFIAIPLFFAGFLITQFDYSIIWRYMAWSNQTLAVITLWSISVYLVVNKKTWIVSLLPAVFMTTVVFAYICFAPEGFKLNYNLSIGVGIAASAIITSFFFIFLKTVKKQKLNA